MARAGTAPLVNNGQSVVSFGQRVRNDAVMYLTANYA